MKRIPVTIITGARNSGKTSLLAHILDTYTEKRFAIIRTKHGSIDLDRSNVSSVIPLESSLIVSLARLIDNAHSFNHVIIESPFDADPAVLTFPFVAEPELQLIFEMDSVICVLNTPVVEDNLNASKDAQQQLTFSDTIIFNHTDETTADYLIAVQQFVQHVNPIARIHSTKHGKTDNFELIGTSGYNPANVERLSQMITGQMHGHHGAAGCGCHTEGSNSCGCGNQETISHKHDHKENECACGGNCECGDDCACKTGEGTCKCQEEKQETL